MSTSFQVFTAPSKADSEDQRGEEETAVDMETRCRSAGRDPNGEPTHNRTKMSREARRDATGLAEGTRKSDAGENEEGQKKGGVSSHWDQ